MDAPIEPHPLDRWGRPQWASGDDYMVAPTDQVGAVIGALP